jgi:hypothetical protein
MLRALSLIGLIWFAGASLAAELGVLAPVMEGSVPLQRRAPDGRRVPVVTRVQSGDLYARLQKEATQGFTATMLALDDEAQRIAGISTPNTMWIYLSLEEGGFARAGFWLREDGRERYLPDPLIDVVVDKGSIDDGGFEEIFAHEMGHIYLRRLLPTLPQGYSRTPHSSLAVTDYPTAFDEGFAIHFQGLVRHLTLNRALRDADRGLTFKPFISYWFSNMDRATRVEGIRRNWFVQSQVSLPGEGGAAGRRDQSALFDPDHLKNGNQMLASEGVNATMFYRWLVPGAEDRPSLVARYSRLFTAIRKVNEQKLTADSPVFLHLVETYCESFPDERERVLNIVVDTTYGATTRSGLQQHAETMGRTGRRNDMQSFLKALEAGRAALEQVRAQVHKSPRALRDGLGPDLWLLVADSVTVNLNTAEIEDLLQLPGIERGAAERALTSRRADGAFTDVNAFIARGGLDPKSAQSIERAAQAMKESGTYFRR